jgi:hypothetical protein
MKMNHSYFLKTLPLLALWAVTAAAQQYVAVDLTPNAAAGAMGFAVSGAAGGSVMALGPSGAYVQHAAEFSAGAINDIHPSSATMSVILSMSGAQQAGLIGADTSGTTHAAIWNGSASSFVDLHPSSLLSSAATCTNGLMQGGYGSVKVKTSGKIKATPPNHALVWFGSALSMLDVNPSTAAESKINGCDQSQEVGYIMPVSPGFTHAALWSGTSSVAVDLHPAFGFDSSSAYGTANFQQVGYGVTVPALGGAGHALLWNGTAASVVDLHPAGYTFSVAFATNGTQQVGEADDSALPRHKHAIVWSGTAASAVDLNQFLPAGVTDAQAMAIDFAGNIVGYAGNHAYMWVPVR